MNFLEIPDPQFLFPQIIVLPERPHRRGFRTNANFPLNFYLLLVIKQRMSKMIAAISPSGIHNPQTFQKGIECIESWGHKIVCASNHTAKYLYTAGTIDQRITDFRWALENPEIELIWFIRGGYGTAELLPSLENIELTKPIIGFSDATVLLSFLWNSGQAKGYHGPVLNSIATLSDEESLEKTRQFLATGKTSELPAQYLFGPKEMVQAPLVGGNLCMLASMCGTRYQLNTKGTILALEDIGEPAYKIDRMLLQLEQAGMFKDLKGILLGEFHNCKIPNQADWTMLDVFARRLDGINVPVYHKAPFGHHKTNWIWQLGQPQTLQHSQG